MPSGRRSIGISRTDRSGACAWKRSCSSLKHGGARPGNGAIGPSRRSAVALGDRIEVRDNASLDLDMRYLALATDYDGTLATDGEMSATMAAAIKRLRKSGRRTILVTGRRLDDLLAICPYVHLFDYVVVENGAVVYAPHTRRTTLLGDRPPPAFTERLAQLGVDRVEVGQVMLSTWLPHHTTVLQVIQEMGLELLIVFNRSAVMVLPAGVNKSTGLDYALRQLGLSFHEVVGVGDAENDHSFLQRCECPVAVANAVPPIRQLAAFVTQGEAERGVIELIEDLIANDLSGMQCRMPKSRIAIASRADGASVTISPYGMNILIAGPSASGKSTIAAGIVERLIEHAYQVCIVDPEGDYGTLQEVITLGSARHPVSLNEALSLLEDPKVNLNINLLGIALADRPAYFGQLLPSLSTLRTRTGRPHWIVLDEAHHLLPAEWGHLPQALPQKLGEVVLVTVHPDHLPRAILVMVDLVIAVGPAPDTTLRGFASAAGHAFTWPDGLSREDEQIAFWFPGGEDAAFLAHAIPPSRDRIRHRRKYAEGNMRYRSFFFRGPGDRHNLRAQNLALFSQIAEGIDEETWLYHLHRGDYSRWFRDAVKDRYLADQAERVEQRQALLPTESRNLIRNLIDTRYTLPE
ncbi:MAG: HAD-IIB family hydrolase [Burkholderiales bacterium]|nr:HAD-IIB family hydrolase [Burkholderiales bacterium]